MKAISTILAAVIGFLAGAFGGYFLYVPLYMVYERCYPLPEGEECARGNGLAYLAILLGGWAFSVFCAVRVATQYDKMARTAPPR